ncbi:diguanylate cyclase domain-containing protein [Comamonas sp. J-3]|uniref:sensor domain-containing diguanylate cyclase n=1 Tax=Comamonas trifloxystrobinivorans TaxID=3350256 RepID=UPI0037291A59
MEQIKIDSTQQRGQAGRIVLMVACALAAAGALWQLDAGWPYWLVLLVPALLWPGLAQWMSQRSAQSDSNDVILAFVDGIVVGLWVALTHFNLLASAVMLMFLVHSTYAMQSARHVVLVLAGAIAGLAVCGLLTSFGIQQATGIAAILGSLLGLALYLAAQGLTTGRLLQTLAHKEQMLTVLRRVDAMTGFFGRAYWNDLAARLFHYAKQKDIPAFMLVVDVDNFRDINSRKGETAGDEVIIAVANTLRNCVRPGDATCRFGGDSFGVLLSGVNLDIANKIADRIHNQVSNRRLREWPDLQISVSIGIASLAKYHQSVEEWIKQAESSLDQAKGAPRMPAAAPDLQPISAEHLAELAAESGPA